MLADVGHILVVDDDPSLRQMVIRYLEDHDIPTKPASNRTELNRHLAGTIPSLIILDLRLGQDDGLDMLREIRSHSDVPVIITTGHRPDEIDRIVGLELGADDYITKPFSIREFRSRVRALLRRAATPHHASRRDEVIDRGELLIDLPRRTVEVRGAAIQLTFVEFELLALLASDPGIVFTRRQLLERIRGSADYREPRTIDVHVRHLREKIERDAREPELILTVRGAGYRFRDR
jgi:DNA-binding response OmpR family regulator